jgi:hypothetical protein
MRHLHDNAAGFMLEKPLHMDGEAAEQLGAYQSGAVRFVHRALVREFSRMLENDRKLWTMLESSLLTRLLAPPRRSLRRL